MTDNGTIAGTIAGPPVIYPANPIVGVGVSAASAKAFLLMQQQMYG